MFLLAECKREISEYQIEREDKDSASHFLQLCDFYVLAFPNLIFFTPWFLKIEILQFSNTSTVVYILEVCSVAAFPLLLL